MKILVLTPYLTELVAVLLAEYVQHRQQSSRAFAFCLKEVRMACAFQLGAVCHNKSLQDDYNDLLDQETF